MCGGKKGSRVLILPFYQSVQCVVRSVSIRPDGFSFSCPINKFSPKHPDLSPGAPGPSAFAVLPNAAAGVFFTVLTRKNNHENV